ncbi:MAG: helix-hairpin-helix domain-containing protein [Bacilli bacterium]|nr:helix-hairpin-helix domain-containing protein [Bacilli bacterium]
MKKIKYYLDKYKIIIILIFLILFLGLAILYTILRPNKKQEVIEPIVEEIKEEVIVEEKIKVDIKGSVNEPNVYQMNNGDRVIDVINKAGGLKEEANTEYINLSKKIVDEMIIIIYSNEQVEKFKEEEKEIIYIQYECVCPDNINDSCITKNDTVNTNGVKEESSVEEDNLVSINKGTLEELMTLSGVGESKAKAIIEYRETNGGFKKLEDIMNVSGIGESAYSKIKNNIKL